MPLPTHLSLTLELDNKLMLKETIKLIIKLLKNRWRKKIDRLIIMF